MRQRRTIAIKTEQPTGGGQPRERGKISGSSLGMGVLAEKTDLLNVLDYIKTLDFVDPIRITLTGCSQGGFVSALAAAEREVLIVHGTKDELVGISYARRACEGYQDCRLVEVNAGHASATPSRTV